MCIACMKLCVAITVIQLNSSTNLYSKDNRVGKVLVLKPMCVNKAKLFFCATSFGWWANENVNNTFSESLVYVHELNVFTSLEFGTLFTVCSKNVKLLKSVGWDGDWRTTWLQNEDLKKLWQRKDLKTVETCNGSSVFARKTSPVSRWS